MGEMCVFLGVKPFLERLKLFMIIICIYIYMYICKMFIHMIYISYIYTNIYSYKTCLVGCQQSLASRCHSLKDVLPDV